MYKMLVIPGAEITQNHIRSKKNSHIVALNIREYISADQPAEDILKEIRRQGAVSIACHPHHRTTTRLEIGTCYLWDHRKRVAELVDVWEAANRDDSVLGHEPEALSVCRQQRLPQAETPVLLEDAAPLREELGGDRADAARERGCRADALPEWLLGGVTARA